MKSIFTQDGFPATGADVFMFFFSVHPRETRYNHAATEKNFRRSYEGFPGTPMCHPLLIEHFIKGAGYGPRPSRGSIMYRCTAYMCSVAQGERKHRMIEILKKLFTLEWASANYLA